MKKRFLYHAEAFGASGSITLPHQEIVEVQASSSLPLTGGHARSRIENFRHRNYFSFKSAETQVIGSFSEKDQAHGSLAMSTIEGLNIMDVVTCDRIVARITSKHPVDGSEPSIIPLGSRFENLRIAGHKLEPELAVNIFTEYDTWTKLCKASGQLRSMSLDEKAESKDQVACTMVQNLERIGGRRHEGGLGIHVPHFGTVYLAEIFAKARERRLLMIRVELGCSVEGGFSGGGAGGNGSFPPPGG
jgi:hypothetical protein